jgi:hypothetical protein
MQDKRRGKQEARRKETERCNQADRRGRQEVTRRA